MGGGRGMLDQEVSKPKNVSATLGRLVRYFKPYVLVLAAVAVLLVLNAWVQVITPRLTGQAIDCFVTPALVDNFAAADAAGAAAASAAGAAVEPGAAAQPGAQSVPTAAQANCTFADIPAGSPQSDYLAGLGRLVLFLILISVLGAAAAGLTFFAMGWTGQHVLRTMQTQVFRHLTGMSIGYYSKVESGDLMSRITNDVNTIQQAMSFALVQVLSGLLLLVWIGWSMLAANAVYALDQPHRGAIHDCGHTLVQLRRRARPSARHALRSAMSTPSLRKEFRACAKCRPSAVRAPTLRRSKWPTPPTVTQT